jgi:hypothetical protein
MGGTVTAPDCAVDRSHREHVPFRHLGIGLGASDGNLLFWLGIGAAQKGAGSKPLSVGIGLPRSLSVF